MAPCLQWECPKPWDRDTFPALRVFPAGSTSGVHIPCGCSSLGCFPFIPGAAPRRGWVGSECPRSQPSPKARDVSAFGAALLPPPLQGTIPLSEPSPVQPCFAPHADRLSGNFPGRLDWFWGLWVSPMGGSSQSRECHGWPTVPFTAGDTPVGTQAS